VDADATSGSPAVSGHPRGASWSVTLPGQPPTLNKLYQPVWRTANDGRRYMGVGKNEDAKRWHDDMQGPIRTACPSGWRPKAYVQLRIRLFLTHDIDADNVLKVLSDAIQTATGVNDRAFLPCVESKEVVPFKDARVEVTLEEIPRRHQIPDDCGLGCHPQLHGLMVHPGEHCTGACIP
jgi:hypothetical protein